MTRRRPAQPVAPYDNVALAFAALEADRLDAELHCVAAAVADPAAGYRAAAAEGVTAELFRCDGCRCCWCALRVVAAMPRLSREQARRLVERGTCHAVAAVHPEQWNRGRACESFGDCWARLASYRWSPGAVAALLGAYPFAAGAVRRNARRLLALDARQREAARLYRELAAVLAAEPEPMKVAAVATGEAA